MYTFNRRIRVLWNTIFMIMVALVKKKIIILVRKIKEYNSEEKRSLGIQIENQKRKRLVKVFEAYIYLYKIALKSMRLFLIVGIMMHMWKSEDSFEKSILLEIERGLSLTAGTFNCCIIISYVLK